MASEFEYEIAFSFLRQDEQLALALHDRLADRYKSFVFPREQEELAGTDGQEAFAKVFGTTARTAVVLYRDGWGSTPWTRTEETIIKNRALAEGWEFLLFVKLESRFQTPKWLPHTYIWHDFERYGSDGAAGAIGALVQRAGGEARLETVEQKAQRAIRAIAAETERKQFRNSEQGVNSAHSGVARIMEMIEAKCAGLAETFEFKSKRGRQPREIAVFGQRTSAMVAWRGHYANTLDGSSLEVSHWVGHPPLTGTNHFPRSGPEQLASAEFERDISTSGAAFWRRTSGVGAKSLSDDALVEELFSHMLDWEVKQALTPRR